MQEITREKAEAIVSRCAVLNSCKSLKNCILVISLNLSNRKKIIVQYNIQERQKSYFIEEAVLN